MRLAGKVAVVTGGGAGIGRGIVLCMAREGADIAIPDIQDANAQAVVKEVLAMGRKAISMRCDVTKDGRRAGRRSTASRRTWAGSTSW